MSTKALLAGGDQQKGPAASNLDPGGRPGSGGNQPLSVRDKKRQ